MRRTWFSRTPGRRWPGSCYHNRSRLQPGDAIGVEATRLKRRGTGRSPGGGGPRPARFDGRGRLARARQPLWDGPFGRR